MKIGLALRGGELITIAQAERGRRCGCVCPACGSPLDARKGNCRIPHFAHQNGYQSPTCVETTAHRLAKEILATEKRLWIPPVFYYIFDYNQLSPAREVCIDEVQVEKPFLDLRPDLTVWAKGHRLFVEIAVTHRVGPEKLEKLWAADVSALEIRLKPDAILDWDTTREAVVGAGRHKIWLSHRKVHEHKRRMDELYPIWWEEPVPPRPLPYDWKLSRVAQMWYKETRLSLR